MKKHRGFAAPLMLGAIAAMSAVSIGLVYYGEHLSRQRLLDDAQSFYHRVVYLRTQIHAYISGHFQMGYPIDGSGIFPPNLNALVSWGYVPSCSDSDNQKGHCMKVNQTPWGEIASSDYRVLPYPNYSSPEYWYAEMDLNLPSESDVALANEVKATRQLLMRLPNVRYDEANNRITVRIDRPDKAFAYDSLVKRSGDDSTLLGDWDVGGNYAITNTKDITIRNSDGSQKLVSRGLVDLYTLKHKSWLKRPACPAGTTSHLALALGTITINKDFELIGSQKPYVMTTTSTAWQVGLEIRAKEIKTGNFVKLNDGEILALTQCK